MALAGPGPVTPSPSVTVTMSTPLGDRPAPTITASWSVTKAGHSATLSVSGASLLTTTVLAVWTAAPHVIRHNSSTGGFRSEAEAYEAPVGGQSSQAIAIRYSKPHGGWGPWGNIAPLFSPYSSLVFGHRVDVDTFYDGPLLPQGQIQYRLVLRLAPGTVVQHHVWSIDA